MTTLHSRCVAKVEGEITRLESAIKKEWNPYQVYLLSSELSPWLALRAVLETHAEDKDGWCSNCWTSSGWPVKPNCPTVLDIGKALGLKDE